MVSGFTRIRIRFNEMLSDPIQIHLGSESENNNNPIRSEVSPSRIRKELFLSLIESDSDPIQKQVSPSESDLNLIETPTLWNISKRTKFGMLLKYFQHISAVTLLHIAPSVLMHFLPPKSEMAAQVQQWARLWSRKKSTPKHFFQ